MATAARVRRDHGTGMVVVVVRWWQQPVFCDFRSWPGWQGCGQPRPQGWRVPTVGVASGAERGRRGHADGGHGGGFGGRDTGWWDAASVVR